MYSPPPSRDGLPKRPDRLRIRSPKMHISEFGPQSIFDIGVSPRTAPKVPILDPRMQHTPIIWNNPFNGDKMLHRPRPAPSIRQTPQAKSSILKAHSLPDIKQRQKSNIAAKMSRSMAKAIGTALKDDSSSKYNINPLGLRKFEAKRVPSVSTNPLGFNGRRPTFSYSRRGSRASRNFSRPSGSSSYQSFSSLGRSVVERAEDYIIQRISGDDFGGLSELRQVVYRLSGLVTFSSIAAFAAYIALRVKFTRDAEYKDNQVYRASWLFIAAELFLALPMILYRVWAWQVFGTRQRPKLRLLGDNVPSVDVVITCSSEEADVILDTAKAACNIDYPAERFRVLVCDDGRSATLAQTVIALVESGLDNLYYRSRPSFPEMPHDFKVGNLNYALEATSKLPGGAAHFLAVLDADMIPERDWLRALLPHMLQEKKCSMAYPPQLFYNIPVDDPLCQSLDTFAHMSEPIKDSLGIAWCPSSGYVLRREALEAIGGFPTGSLSEEENCTSMLLGSGWHTAIVQEPLQWGTVPNSLQNHLDQRARWMIGSIQTAIKLRFCLFGPLMKNSSIKQRLCGFVYSLGSFLVLFQVLAMLAIPAALLTRATIVPYTSTSNLGWMIRANFLSALLDRVNELIACLPSGKRTGQRDIKVMIWMAPFQTIAVIRVFLLPKWLGGKSPVSSSSSDRKYDVNERDARFRDPLFRRLKVTLWDCKAYLHVLYIGAVLTAVGLSTYWCIIDQNNNSLGGKLEAVLTHAGWPPLVWFVCASSCWLPISYALFPPSVPDREDLLKTNAKTGVSHPTAEAKKSKFSWWSWIEEFHFAVLTAYGGFLFIFSFLY